jgi:hypothetical protein
MGIAASLFGALAEFEPALIRLICEAKKLVSQDIPPRNVASVFRVSIRIQQPRRSPSCDRPVHEFVEIARKAVTASRGKVLRAEPIRAFYEQGRVHHVGVLPEL